MKITVPAELHVQLFAKARAEKKTMSAIAAEAIREKLNEGNGNGEVSEFAAFHGCLSR
jgi:hypothetical protein